MSLVLRPLFWVEVCRREPELRQLTDTSAFSDMNQLLDQAQMGEGALRIPGRGHRGSRGASSWLGHV